MQGKETDENTPALKLDLGRGFECARQLALIPKFPRHQEARDFMAEWFENHCRGAVLDGETWSPEHQAVWLVETAIEQFKDWEFGGGVPGLLKLFNHKFHPPPALKEFRATMTPEPIVCTRCKDLGTVQQNGKTEWCSCQQAVLLRKDKPRLVEVLNKPQKEKREKKARLRLIEQQIERQLAARRNDAAASNQQL